ncbi:MAG TPA: NAD(P)/FAD-dependent oxidoreductase [Acidimicrobiales bacterium]|nr:NAD(P)/FAD-dependent oxidoreductase [Acidimicrobiales bacterium]
MATDQTALREYDVIVLGAGPTGENVAERAVQGGLSAVIVEHELVGGECSYWACMPSKAMLRPLHAVAEARRVGGAREAVTGEVDVRAVFARRDEFTSHWDDSGQVQWLDGVHVELVRGHGRLAGERRVDVETASGAVVLRARQAVVVATGSVATLPPVPGLAEAKPWTPREATSARAVPVRLTIIGGGVVGCEMAHVYCGLGSQVTVLEVAPRLLMGNEPFVGELIAEATRSLGADVRTGVKVLAARRDGSGVHIELEGGTVSSDEVLVAAGRRPATSDIGLETVGLEPGAWLETDDSLLVHGAEGAWLYAAGDVNHRALLTHMGKYQARACGDGIAARARGSLDPAPWSKHSATADHRCVPSVIFTDPEVGSVGLTEGQARGAGLNVRAVDYTIGDVAGASLYADHYGGRARLVVDEERHVLVGATFVGPAVGELLHSATVAVVGEVPLERLWHAVPSYPTISEVWLRLLETYGL